MENLDILLNFGTEAYAIFVSKLSGPDTFLNKMLRIPICMEFRCDIVAMGG